MRNAKGEFVKGHSGNPNGRPPKGQALTDLLERAGSQTIEYKGKKTARKRVLAQLVWQATTMGYIEFPDGRKEVFDPDKWASLARWIYTRLDGPPAQSFDIAHSGDIHVALDWGDPGDEPDDNAA